MSTKLYIQKLELTELAAEQPLLNQPGRDALQASITVQFMPSPPLSHSCAGQGRRSGQVLYVPGYNLLPVAAGFREKKKEQRMDEERILSGLNKL
jgi:hypothetical protein